MFVYLFFIFSISLFLFCFKEIGFSLKRKNDNEIAKENIVLGDRAKLDYDIRYLSWQASFGVLILSVILLLFYL